MLTSTGGDSGQAPVYTSDIHARAHIDAFAIVGDTQRTSRLEFWWEQNDRARAALMKRVAVEEPAFVLHLGDLVFAGSNANHWEHFDEVARPVRQRRIPLIPIPGNHDFWWRSRKAQTQYFARFPDLHERRWRAFTFRSIGLILLDSNRRRMTRQERDRQDAWYRATLSEFQSDPAIAHILVACHHPPYTNSKVIGPDKVVRQGFAAAFDATAKARAFFSGHCHSYEHFIVNEKHYIVSGGGGGPRHRLHTDSNRRYEDSYPGGALRAFHYCRVFTRGGELRMQMIRAGDGLNKWTIGEEFAIPAK